MTYTEDMVRLAMAVAGLLAAGPAPAGTLRGGQRPATLTARDAVVAALRDLTHVLLDPRMRLARAGDPPVSANPVVTLQHGLAAVQPAAGADRIAATDALTLHGGPLTRGWQDAARAAATLEAHHTALSTGTAGGPWLVARDVADVAEALPYLDADLAAALEPSDPARAGLLDPVAHSLVRLAAADLRAHSAELAAPSDRPAPPAPSTQQPTAVRAIGDLPAATRGLADLVASRGDRLTALETRAVARALSEGLDALSRVLPAAVGPAAGDPGRHLHIALPHLLRAAHEQIATLYPPAGGVLDLTGQIQHHLAVVTRLLDNLDHDTAPGARDRATRVAGPLTRWAVEACDTAAALHRSLSATVHAGNLFVPGDGLPRTRRPGAGTWTPAPPATAADQPVVTAVRRASDSLSAARPQLTDIADALTGADPAHAATRHAAHTAGAAHDQLRAALATRTPGDLLRTAPSTRQAPAADGPTRGTRRA